MKLSCFVGAIFLFTVFVRTSGRPAGPTERDATEARKGGGGAQASPSPGSSSSSNSTSAACFPADAIVELVGGRYKQMERLQIGDMVKVGPAEFSKVFAFTHRVANINSRFVRLETAIGHVLEATSGHYLYVNGVLKQAEKVAVGESLLCGNGDETTVATAKVITKRGIFNPQTIHGDIVVGGIISSTYTTAVEPDIAHASLAVIRFIYRVSGVSISFLEDGGPAYLGF